MSKITQLAGGPITKLDGLSIELHQSADEPAFVMILWPPQPTEILADPKSTADLATAVVKIFGHAQTRLRMIRPRPRLDL